MDLLLAQFLAEVIFVSAWSGALLRNEYLSGHATHENARLIVNISVIIVILNLCVLRERDDPLLCENALVLDLPRRLQDGHLRDLLDKGSLTWLIVL